MSTISATMIAALAKQAFRTTNLPPNAEASRGGLENFIIAASNAVGTGMQQWQQTACLSGVMINGPVAMGGQVVGPTLGALVRSGFTQAQDVALTNAFIKGVDTAFGNFIATLKVRGLPWYPAFAAFPGPIAPPRPNVPVPLIMLCTQGGSGLSKAAFYGPMLGFLGGLGPYGGKEALECIASALETAFSAWLTGTSVTNVMGSGPVPMFSPPAVMAGPVVGGIGNMMPGGFV